MDVLADAEEGGLNCANAVVTKAKEADATRMAASQAVERRFIEWSFQMRNREDSGTVKTANTNKVDNRPPGECGRFGNYLLGRSNVPGRRGFAGAILHK